MVDFLEVADARKRCACLTAKCSGCMYEHSVKGFVRSLVGRSLIYWKDLARPDEAVTTELFSLCTYLLGERAGFSQRYLCGA